MSFSEVQAPAVIDYIKIGSPEIDTGPASLDNKPVEVEITEARSSSTNPSLFPEGMAKDDYDAYSVVPAGGATRIRIAAVIRRDSASSKVFDRCTPTDTLRIRGTARTVSNPGALSIVVDTVETV